MILTILKESGMDSMPGGGGEILVDEVRNLEPVPFAELGPRASAALLQVAGLSREIQVDARYGTWDRAVGRVAPPAGPLAPALARLGS